jgi:hypothetical protein
MEKEKTKSEQFLVNYWIICDWEYFFTVQYQLKWHENLLKNIAQWKRGYRDSVYIKFGA